MTTSDNKLHGGAQRLPVRWANSPAPLMTISRYQVEGGQEVSSHVHTGKAEYWLIVRGQGVATVGAQQIAVSEGDVIATEPGVPHSLRNTSDSASLEFGNVVKATGEPITTRELS